MRKDWLAVAGIALAVSGVAGAAALVTGDVGSTAAGPRAAFAQPDDGPELGTADVPPTLRTRLAGKAGREKGRAVNRADVLATSGTGATRRLVLGHVDQESRTYCLYQYSEAQDESFSGGCNSIQALDEDGFVDVTQTLGVQGAPDLLYGFGPRGTSSVEITSVDGTSTTARAYAGGGGWHGLKQFMAPWSAAVSSELTALDARGRVLARMQVRPLR
jgi:hypothetical protein